MRLRPVEIHVGGALRARVDAQPVVVGRGQSIVLTLDSPRIRWHLGGVRVPRWAALLYLAIARPAFAFDTPADGAAAMTSEVTS